MIDQAPDLVAVKVHPAVFQTFRIAPKPDGACSGLLVLGEAALLKAGLIAVDVSEFDDLESPGRFGDFA